MDGVLVKDIVRRTINYKTGMRDCVIFLSNNIGKAFDAAELSKEFNLSIQTVLASMGREAKLKGFDLHYSRSNNMGKVMVWLQPRIVE
jgi:NADPH-dependent glutamate synthase beta subunit-like oxidoreductase